VKTIKTYWLQQFSQIKEEGSEAIWRKLKTVSRRTIVSLLTLLMIPLVLIIRIIKPRFWIRFGWFFGSRIGHFAFDVEYYLSERKLGMHPEKAIDVFFYRWGRPANNFFSKLTKRQLYVGIWVEPLFIANDWLPGGERHKILPAVTTNGSRDMKGLLRKVGPQLKFINEEIVTGQSFLQSIGIKDEKFVCVIVRDSKYLPGASYHNYRNSEIDSFEETALALVERGYSVFRMGKIVDKPFTVDHPHIFDYASSKYRSDFLDIWLMANCTFCISTGTGLDEVSRIFLKPGVYVNYLPLFSMVSYDHVLTVPPKLIWQDSDKELTFMEHLIHNYYEIQKYEKEGIRIEKLSSHDILKAVLEQKDRLNGTWQDTEEDQQLQFRFWELFKTHKDFHKYHGDIHPEARIGAHFLRNNPEWLN